jgi:hypothetical protein
MKHFSEEELIAYQLHENEDEREVRRHLELCSPCAALSDSIAETLRVFSAEPVPEPDFDRSWERLRVSLPMLAPKPNSGFSLLPSRRAWPMNWLTMWPTICLATAALVLLTIVVMHLHHTTVRVPNYAIGGHGPLTTQPSDPAIANHLDAAERLLTEVNHTAGPLDEATRSQAHELLAKNALYVRAARESGDLGEAVVLDNLGRTLTSLDNEDGAHYDAWQFRVESNTSGLLFEIRILRQNNDHNQTANP